jgi:hypothetical protein
MVWYRREDYRRIRTMMSDTEDMHETFEQWLATAEEIEEQLRGQGHAVRRIRFQARAFEKWCRASGRELNGASRSEWATKVGRRSNAE